MESVSMHQSVRVLTLRARCFSLLSLSLFPSLSLPPSLSLLPTPPPLSLSLSLPDAVVEESGVESSDTGMIIHRQYVGSADAHAQETVAISVSLTTPSLGLLGTCNVRIMKVNERERERGREGERERCLVFKAQSTERERERERERDSTHFDRMQAGLGELTEAKKRNKNYNYR